MKKGFTLIELLAVIVILAIIALIATPIVLNIISETKESSQLRGSQFYIDAVEHSVTREMLKDSNFKPSICKIEKDGNLLCDNKTIKVDVKGETPNDGIIVFETGKIIDITLITNNKVIEKQDKDFIEINPGLYDAEGKLIATWSELVNDYKIDIGKDYDSDQADAPGKILKTDEKLKQGTKLVIDTSVKKIGDYAFFKNDSIEEIVIGIGVTNIGEFAFYECSSLEKIKIPSSVISIGYCAFERCLSLKEITIPKSVTTIGDYAFKECRSLEKIEIPKSVTTIGRATFKNCSNLKEVIIPDTVTSIAQEAFKECTSLKEIEIPAGVTSIENYVFENCESLEHVVIPDKVTSIGVGAFRNCAGLKSVVLPANLTSIGYEAFASSKNLKLINYKGSEEKWNTITFEKYWMYGTSENMVIIYNYN